jgi:hypothetical protein
LTADTFFFFFEIIDCRYWERENVFLLSLGSIGTSKAIGRSAAGGKAMVAPYDEPAWSEEAARRVWDGAVPLQVHLHDADVTSLPPPPPFLVPFPLTALSSSEAALPLISISIDSAVRVSRPYY